jgi:hypothetical protein
MEAKKVVSLQVEELEERIAPGALSIGVTAGPATVNVGPISVNDAAGAASGHGPLTFG